MFDLNGKVAVVTGAAHGIGRAIAEVLGEARATVVLVDVDQDAGASAAAKINGATFARADVSSSDEVTRVVNDVAIRFGRIDVLCNNAAYLGSFHAAAEATADEWDRCINVSLLGTRNFTRDVLPYMIRQGGGSIINVSSVQGLVAGRDSAAYTSVKHALIGLTRSVAYDYGKHNVRANAICPGAITTRISPQPGTELHQRQISKTMLGRIGQPREVAYAALFLASDESAYVTGAVLPVDGGWTAM
jgi:NAD(P)-dependent dehydrogenase (short-subunit alcohol dehydrogenase family)